MRLAALTMVYNEPVWARVWARYYGSQVGAEHCYVLDHGSTDGSVNGLPARVERMERSALDEEVRARVVGAYVERLLQSYDAVVHSDADELVMADPAQFANLRAYAALASEPVVTSVGLDLQHLPGEEAPLNPARPVGAQRRWVRFSGSMCKPAFVRRPVVWRPGFHSCDAEPVFAGLFLIHLRYADLQLGLARLGRTRGQEFASAETNPHQRINDDAFASMVRTIATLPRERFWLSERRQPLRGWLDRARRGWAEDDAMLGLAGDRLWQLPKRARDLF